MLKQLNRSALQQLLEKVAAIYALQAPIRLADGSRQLARYGSGQLSLAGEPLQRKPTAAFFPQSELLLTLTADGSVQSPPEPRQPLALFGLNRADLAALAFLDRFFCAPPADDIYQQKRQGALLIGLSGYAGPDAAFLPLCGGNCDLELCADENSWLGIGYSATGKLLLDAFPDGDPARLAELKTQSAQAEPQIEKLQQAAELLRNDSVPDSFWEEIAARCILCAGCNYACPTCSCFCVQDRQTLRGTERSRVWDSCQLDAFMREASGHNPLGTEALRTRRRIHHKLVADVERWGKLGCVACGRCDRACPVGIGMFAVVEEMLARFAD